MNSYIKVFLIFLFFEILNVYISGAEEVNYPHVMRQSEWNYVITKIERNKDNTKVFIYYRTPEITGGWINISPLTYLVDSQHKVYALLSVEGIPLSPSRYMFKNMGEGVAFTLKFPAIPKSIYYFNIDEEVPNGFHIDGVKFNTDYATYQRRYQFMNDEIDRMEKKMQEQMQTQEEIYRSQTKQKVPSTESSSHKKIYKKNKLKKNPNFKIE